MPRLLLRFGNQRADTITEHRDVMGDLGFVWWGWWAKAWEKAPTAAEWATISAAVEDPTPIGLFDRRNLRFYLAMCDGVHRSVDSTGRIVSPEPEATPRYYSDDVFPVWFRLTDIRTVSEAEFLTEFGFVPLSEDKTLYWYDPASPPEENWLEIVRTRSPNILHLSDLHFGDDHGHGGDAETGVRQLDEVIGSYLRDSDLDIGVVVISGDLITKGVERFFRDVSSFFDALLGRLGLERHHLVVVPGNHDLWLDDASSFKYSHHYAHELGYREWHDSFFASPGADIPLERLHVFDCDNGQRLAFIQVNSARLRERETMEYGFVGSHRYEQLLRNLSQMDRERLLSFFVMHHHLVPVPGGEHVRDGRPISVTVDAGHIIENLQRYRVDYVLHGHQHLPFIGSTGRMSFADYGDAEGYRHPVHILGAGSAGAKADRLSGAFRLNTFNLYEIGEDESLTARVIQCAPGGITREWVSARLP